MLTLSERSSPIERAALLKLRQRQADVADTLLKLRRTKRNDAFFDVCQLEIADAENAKAALDGEAAELEATIRDSLDAARRSAHRDFVARHRADILEMLKLAGKARDIRRKLVEALERYQEDSGYAGQGLPLHTLEQVDEMRDWLKANDLL